MQMLCGPKADHRDDDFDSFTVSKSNQKYVNSVMFAVVFRICFQ